MSLSRAARNGSYRIGVGSVNARFGVFVSNAICFSVPKRVAAARERAAFVASASIARKAARAIRPRVHRI